MKTFNFVVGDIVAVHQKIKEDSKTRTQVFEGVVLGIKGRGENRTFTVRRTIGDVAIERIWPIYSPSIQKIDVKGHIKNEVRRAKLTYLRKSL